MCILKQLRVLVPHVFLSLLSGLPNQLMLPLYLYRMNFVHPLFLDILIQNCYWLLLINPIQIKDYRISLDNGLYPHDTFLHRYMKYWIKSREYQW